MTAIGKMLVILVLVLSLVWNALVINGFAARTNWQREAKRSQAEAVAAAESANKMKGLRDAEAESADDAKRALQQERDRYYTQVAQLVAVRDTLSQQYNVAFSEKQKEGAKAALQQAMIDKLSGQIKVIDDDLKRREEEKNQLVIAKNNANAAQTRAEIERDRYKAAAERNLELAQKNQDTINEMKLGVGGIGGVRPPAVRADFRGTVTIVDRDKATGVVYVQFSPGIDAGLKEGAVLRINRLAPAGRYVGRLTVVTATLKAGVGTFEPAAKGTAPSADSLPKVGDEVNVLN